MPKKVQMSGNEAVANALRQINPDVFPMFPITPSTEIPQYFANYVSNGLVDTEFITVESEHEAAAARAVREAVLRRPGNGRSIVAVRRNIGKRRIAGGLGHPGSTPQERDGLRAGARQVRRERRHRRAVHHAAGQAPDDGVIEIGVLRHIPERELHHFAAADAEAVHDLVAQRLKHPLANNNVRGFFVHWSMLNL